MAITNGAEIPKKRGLSSRTGLYKMLGKSVDEAGRFCYISTKSLCKFWFYAVYQDVI